MRSVSNFSTGFPNMRGHVTNHAATVAEVLRDEGYATFAVGKWHLCQMEDASAAGPFDQWPCQRGFERFYGFLDGETDQFYPDLVYDNHHIDPPGRPEDGYHLSEDLVDHAIGFIHDTISVRPERPFFTYLAFGATHAPHQAPASYLDKYRGRFDAGWDAARDEWFARQQQMGLLPPSTLLAPRNPGVEAWDSLPDPQRRLAARLQEAFAAFLEHTDAQIGRFLQALDHIGVADNTLIFLLSDNGASQEGGPFGVMHEMKFFNFILEEPQEAVARIDDIGGPNAHTNYPWGWAQAGNTPFKWYKQNTHEGGVHVPLVVRWPSGIDAGHSGTLRDQFHFVSDVVPTIYEVVGIEPPGEYRGWEQLPLSGTSMR
ncbi:MAG TPA: sulfatase-like hydrolase/transferase, partial [Mycobacterium sp.]|nr:sulfatase-like hydrolase/transferase [Mycobacterium sp.]